MQCSKEYRYSMQLRPNPSERVTLASPARLPSDLHVIMHPQIVETDRQLTRRYVASVPRCWAMWIGLTESRSAGGTDQAAGCGPARYSGLGGHDRTTAPEYFGLMGVAHGPLRRCHSGKGRAVPERPPVDPPSLADQSGGHRHEYRSGS